MNLIGLKGYKWLLPSGPGSNEQMNHDILISGILQARNIPNHQEFLNTSLMDHWPKVSDLPDLQVAIDLILDAKAQNLKIGIVGDYDVDGSSATAILVKVFGDLHMNFIYRIPNRFLDGYGISTRILHEFVEAKVDIVITVDHGTTAYEAIEFLKTHNIKLIIIDHHSIQKPIQTDAFINPHRDANSPYRIMCATGLVFVFVVELNKVLWQQKIIETKLDMNYYLDMVATATVCDVMPLIGINRALVTAGLKKLNTNPHPGFGMLLGKSGNIIHDADVYRIGFHIGPYLNAPGRFGHGDITVKFLVSDNVLETRKLLISMLIMNTERKEQERLVTEEVTKNTHDLNGLLFAVGDEWHEGVLGIVAGRLKDQHNMPTCVLTKVEHHGIIKGSLRSVPGFHIGACIKEGILAGVIKYGGGHELAGGLTIEIQKETELREFFRNYIKENPVIINDVLKLDVFLSIAAVNLKTYTDIQKLAPYGAQNPEPIFFFGNCYVKDFFIIQNKHCIIKLGSQNTFHEASAIVFNIMDTPFSVLMKKNLVVHVAANLKLVPTKKIVQLHLVDLVVGSDSDD